VTSSSSHGPATRRQVEYGGRKIPSLWCRDLIDGTIVYEAHLRINGKKKKVILEARTITEAIRELKALQVDRDRGTVHENPLVNPTMAELFDELAAHMQARVGISDEKRRYAQGTVDVLRQLARLYVVPFLGHKPVASVTTADLRRLIEHLQSEQPNRKALSPTTTTNSLLVVSRALGFAVTMGYVDRNVYRDLSLDDRPGHKRLTEPRYLTADEVKLLLDCAGRDVGRSGGRDQRRDPAMLGCMVYAALRISETLGLTWGNVDFKTNEIMVAAQLSRDRRKLVPPKSTASKASVAMMPALRRLLLEWRGALAERNLALVRPDALVFVSRTGRPLHRGHTLESLRLACAAAKLDPPGLPPVGFHDLRHTAIALAIKSGAPINEVSEFARHANPAVTLVVYAGLAKDSRGGAVRRMLDAGYGS
jgi:integrase